MRGMLVPQNKNDEDALKLKAKIDHAIEGLIAKKVIKRTPHFPSVNDEEILFEIPETWIWVRLGEIGQVIGGGTPKTKIKEYWSDSDEGIPWLTPADLSGYNGMYISRGRRNITQLGLEKSSATLMPKGSVLFSSRAPIGYVAISENEISTNQGFKSVVPHLLEMSQFIYYFLLYIGEKINEEATGTTFKEISGKGLSLQVMPLPPLEEQKRIVDKISHLFELCDQWDNEVGYQQKTLSRLRNKILDDAVRGLIVPQNEVDKPASGLLDNIREQKEQLINSGQVKKVNSEPIDNSEIPYDLPHGWEWVRLGDIASQITDGVHKTPNYIEEGVPFLSVKNISKGFLDFSDTKFVSQEEHEEMIKRCNPEKGDILFCRIGTLGKAIAIKEGKEFSIFVSLGLLKLMDKSLSNFIEMVMKSPMFYKQIDQVKVTGSHTDKINLRDVPNFMIPIPPIEEQKRIIRKVEKLFSELYEFEKSIVIPK